LARPSQVSSFTTALAAVRLRFIGKSTLRKQFQLQWASRTLDAERATWRPIVALNIIRGLHNLFDQLEAAFDPTGHSPLSNSAPPSLFRGDREYARTDSRTSSPGSSAHEHGYPSLLPQQGPLDPAIAIARDQLLFLRECLLPLISMEDSLTSSISGMIRAVGGVYIRSDWQASFARSRDRDAPARSSSAPPGMNLGDRRRELRERTDTDIIDSVQRCLAACRDYIRDLWHHPYLPILMKARRIKLEDSISL
jgi:hypothetical protein